MYISVSGIYARPYTIISFKRNFTEGVIHLCASLHFKFLVLPLLMRVSHCCGQSFSKKNKTKIIHVQPCTNINVLAQLLFSYYLLYNPQVLCNHNTFQLKSSLFTAKGSDFHSFCLAPFLLFPPLQPSLPSLVFNMILQLQV